MPNIQISDELLARLKRHAEPLVDTFETVISKMADTYENGSAPAAAPGPAPDERQINPRNLPRLTHTKVLDASIGGTPVRGEFLLTPRSVVGRVPNNEWVYAFQCLFSRLRIP